MPLESIFRDTVARHRMFRPGHLVLVAVSGGADSTALLHLLAAMREELGLELHVAHLNHGWRGAESSADRAFVESMARRLGLPATCESSSASAGRSEAEARSLRYAFLHRTAERLGADRIATGHTRDDQAETVLLRLMRGAGARGLGGIPAVRDHLVRPLLDASRAQVEAWLQACDIVWREDRTNRDLAYERNRVRHELIPYMEREFRPGIAARLAAAADLLRDDADYLDARAAELYRAMASPLPGGAALPASELLGADPALRRRVLRQALQEVASAAAPPGRAAIERLDRLMRAGRPGNCHLPGGIRAELAGDALLLRSEAQPEPEPFAVEAEVPGRIDWPDAGISLRLQEVDRTDANGDIRRAPREIAYLDMERTGARLVLRSRRRGDVFHPLGLGARKKLQDFLVDARVPRTARDRIGLLTAGGDVAWVVGHRIDDRFKITDSTRRVLRVSQERV